jgi:hypothetical protein
MVIGAYQYQVGQFGRAAVFPVLDVVGVQTAGGSAAGDRAAGMAVLQGAAKPPVDHPGRSAGADDLAVALEPDFTGGVTGQVSALGVGEQCGRRAAASSQPASTRPMNASTAVGNGGQFSDTWSPRS